MSNRFRLALEKASNYPAKHNNEIKAAYWAARKAGRCTKCGKPTCKSRCEDCALTAKLRGVA